jgi:hypothetical protein
MTTDVDFSCHKCGKECDSAPNPPARAICPACCEDHDYEYDRGMGGKFCKHCGEPAPYDYYED